MHSIEEACAQCAADRAQKCTQWDNEALREHLASIQPSQPRYQWISAAACTMCIVPRMCSVLTPTPQPASSELGVVDISLYLFGTSWMKIAITPVMEWSCCRSGPYNHCIQGRCYVKSTWARGKIALADH